MPDKPPTYEVTFTCLFKVRGDSSAIAGGQSRALRIAKDALTQAVCANKKHPLIVSYQGSWNVREADVTETLSFDTPPEEAIRNELP